MAVCGLMLSLGCSHPVDPIARETVPVSLEVSFKGEPIPDGVIVFHPVSPEVDDRPLVTPRGTVDRDGNVVVSTYSRGDGAPPGEYRLSVNWQGPLEGVDEDAADQLPERIPPKYRNPETSGLRLIVVAGADNKLPPILLN